MQKEKSTISKVKNVVKAAANVVKTSVKLASNPSTENRKNAETAKLKLSAAQFATTKSADQLKELASKARITKDNVSKTLNTQRANIDKARGGRGPG